MLNEARRDVGGPSTFTPPGPIPSPQPPADVYQDFNQQQGTPQPRPQQVKQPQTPQSNPQPSFQEDWDESPEDFGGEEVEYYRGGGLTTGLKVAGILLILLMIFIGYKSVTGISKKKNKELENLLRMNPTGGYYTSNPSNSTNSEDEGGEVGVGDVAGLETEIMRYEKKISLDGRPMLTLESETYGIFDIFIPHHKYTSLEQKGYLLVDAEVINGKVTFLYISNKQDNLNKLLDKGN